VIDRQQTVGDMVGKKSHCRDRRSSLGPAARLDAAARPTHAGVVHDVGRLLVAVGLLVTVIGAGLLVLPQLPWLGRLPGDIHVERDHFSFHFPLVTCLVVSAVVTLLLNFFFRR